MKRSQRPSTWKKAKKGTKKGDGNMNFHWDGRAKTAYWRAPDGRRIREKGER